jgi:acyl-CoA synthetase (AMP-forming)/AMP-acid ligase II
VTAGYENNSEANASCFTDGWFRTGDQGFLDSNGYLTLVGRLKELINRGGEKISPREIDEVLLAHPAVAEAVCFGVPHPTWGEEVAAVVVLRNAATEADLQAFCRERLADYKRPKRIHITETIPRTATGKIQRRIVAQAFPPTDS